MHEVLSNVHDNLILFFTLSLLRRQGGTMLQRDVTVTETTT